MDSMTTQVIIVAIIGYALGAIPFSWLLTRLATGKDIRHEGSGNVGAMNAYETSKHVWIGIAAAVLDMLKAALAVFLASLIGNGVFSVIGIAVFFVVTGHNYNIFLRMRGGRGLAPAAGAMAAINPLPVLLFCVMWVTGYYIIRKNVHVANVSGIIGMVLLLFSVPDKLLQATSILPSESSLQLTFLVLLVGGQILMRHAQPIRQIMASSHNVDGDDK